MLEKEMTTHSSTLAWKILWTEEPGRLQPMGLQTVRHNWATSLHSLHFILYHWRRMAIHSSILAWRISWTEEPARPWSMGSQSRTQLKWLSMHAGNQHILNTSTSTMRFLLERYCFITRAFGCLINIVKEKTS